MVIFSQKMGILPKKVLATLKIIKLPRSTTLYVCKMSSVSFGVHFGRSSICLAVEKDGRCDVVANDAGDRVTPAVVGFTENEVLVGLSAKQLSTRKPGCIASDSKGKIAENDLSDYQIKGEGFNKNGKVEDVHTRIFKYMKGIDIVV